MRKAKNRAVNCALTLTRLVVAGNAPRSVGGEANLVVPAAIRTLRRALDLSAKDFAIKLGFTGKHRGVTIWRWENGQRTPSVQTVMLMQRLWAEYQSKQK